MKAQTPMTIPQIPKKSRYPFNKLKVNCQDLCQEFTALLTTWNHSCALRQLPTVLAQFMTVSPDLNLSLSLALDMMSLNLLPLLHLPDLSLIDFYYQTNTRQNTGPHAIGTNAKLTKRVKTDTTTPLGLGIFLQTVPSTLPLALFTHITPSEDLRTNGPYHPYLMMTKDIQCSTQL